MMLPFCHELYYPNGLGYSYCDVSFILEFVNLFGMLSIYHQLYDINTPECCCWVAVVVMLV